MTIPAEDDGLCWWCCDCEVGEICPHPTDRCPDCVQDQDPLDWDDDEENDWYGLEWACDVVQRLGTNAKLAFAVDAILTKATNRWSGEEYDRALVSACKVWGVDLAALEQAEKARRAKKAVA